jgi:hypothetical protein
MHRAPEQPAHEPVAWKHDCAALLMNDVELWIDQCPHCGKPRTSPQQRAGPSSALSANLKPSGLVLCEGEPASYLYKFNSAFGDGPFWSHRPTHNGNDALESVPLYRALEQK